MSYLSALRGEPVLPPNWIAWREPHRGSWHLNQLGAADRRAGGTQADHPEGHYVADDFGALLPLPLCAQDAAWDWSQSHLQSIEESAFSWLEAQRRAAELAVRAEQAAKTTRALLRPPRVTVGWELESPDDWCVFTLRIGGDPAPIEAPHYRIHVAGNEPLCVSHAQLLALLVAAQELCQPASEVRQ